MAMVSEEGYIGITEPAVESQNGAIFALVNALNHERANHTIHTAHAIGELLRRGVHHSKQFVDNVLCPKHVWTVPPREVGSPAQVRSASITRSTSEGFRRFFEGFWSCPNGSQFATIASNAGDHLRKVVSVNGQLALSGVNLDKQRRAKLPDDQIRAMFDDMDSSGNGFIDTEEFQRLIQHLGLPASKAFLRDALSKFNETAEGVPTVSYEQFRSYFDHSTEKLWLAFDSLDDEHHGFITEGGLLRALRGLGMSAKPEDAHRMIHLLDRNCDEAITFEEFCRFACMLPRNQIENNNVAFCWVDSADFMDGHAFRLNMVPSKQPWQRLLGGAFAGAASRSLVAPLERLRTIAMASPNAMPPLHVVSVALRDGGPLGLFRGNTATLVKIVPASAVQFAVYEALRDALKAAGVFAGGAAAVQGRRSRGAGPEHLLAGFVAGAAQCLVSHPLETIRTLMAVPGCTQGNFFQAAQQAIRRYGVRGLYAGLKPSLVGDMIGTGLGFFAYEKANGVFEHVTGRPAQAIEKGAVGAASATVVMTGTMPLELIQRRMQVSRTSAGAAFQYSGLNDAFVTIWRQEGFSAFFRGSAFSYLKIPISIGAMYALYEAASNVMAWDGLRSYKRDQAEFDGQRARLEQQRANGDREHSARVRRDFGELVSVARPVQPASVTRPPDSGAP